MTYQVCHYKNIQIMITDIRRQKSVSLNAVQCNTTSRPIFFFYLKLLTDKNLKPSAVYVTEYGAVFFITTAISNFNQNKY